MARPRRNDSWRPFSRRITACVALVCYLATAVGFPVAKPQSKDRGQPFPCQDHPCGCQSAEQCWRHCCCFSPEERLAWAEARHVEPPSYAERPAAHGWHTAHLRDGTSGGEEKHGCTHCRTLLTCQDYLPLARKNCCADRPKPPVGIPWVLGVASLRCHGAATLWVSIGAVLPPPAPLEWRDWLPPIGWLSQRDASPVPLPYTPPDPPPRTSCA
jgi:hypothetical protein